MSVSNITEVSTLKVASQRLPRRLVHNYEGVIEVTSSSTLTATVHEQNFIMDYPFDVSTLKPDTNYQCRLSCCLASTGTLKKVYTYIKYAFKNTTPVNTDLQDLPTTSRVFNADNDETNYDVVFDIRTPSTQPTKLYFAVYYGSSVALTGTNTLEVYVDTRPYGGGMFLVLQTIVPRTG